MANRGRDALDRMTMVHRWDCPAVASEPALPPAEVADVDMAAPTVLRRPYDGLRRLIGQAAGLLLLAQASRQREIVDLPAIAVAREQWKEITAELASLNAPQGCERHAAHLVQAARLIGACLDALDAAAAREVMDVSLALDRVAAAYRLAQSCSIERLGLTMVDFRQSCCNCAPMKARA